MENLNLTSDAELKRFFDYLKKHYGQSMKLFTFEVFREKVGNFVVTTNADDELHDAAIAEGFEDHEHKLAAIADKEAQSEGFEDAADRHTKTRLAHNNGFENYAQYKAATDAKEKAAKDKERKRLDTMAREKGYADYKDMQKAVKKAAKDAE